MTSLPGQEHPTSAALPGLDPLPGWVAQQQLKPGQRPGDIVTGDAVVLDMVPASVATRGLAYLIDAVLLVLLMASLAYTSTKLLSLLEIAAASALWLVILVGVMVFLPVAVETLTHGKSPGKYALGLRVVRDDAGPIRLRHAMIRGLMAVPEMWMLSGGPAVITALLSSRGKRVGDMLAGTYVVTERPPRRELALAIMPAALASWARGADIGRIPDQIALKAREILGRATTMDPVAAHAQALEAAQGLIGYVSPPPPAAAPPLMVIAAILAERRERDLQRLLVERDRRNARSDTLHTLPFGLR